MSPDQLLDAARRRVRAVLAGRVVVRFAWMAALCALAGWAYRRDTRRV